MTSHKKIGTLLPLSSIRTEENKNQPNGTIDDGLIFLDWLTKTGQSAWQMLPLHETHLERDSSIKHVLSPYKGYGIGLDPKYASAIRQQPATSDLEHFLSIHNAWLPDYALFCALRDHFGTDKWVHWEKNIRSREKNTLLKWKNKLIKEINKYIIKQWHLHENFLFLRKKAYNNHISLIGDLPFYLPFESPLVWMHQESFLINSDGTLPRVSGIPNDPEAIYGRQIWGHPLYRWENQASTLSLFSLRLMYLSTLFDMVRFDHAAGLFSYGSLDISNEKNDQLLPGPGFFALEQILRVTQKNNLQLFLEDAATKVNDLRNAMNSLDIAGVRTIRSAYDEKKDIFIDEYADITKYPRKSVCYTTTHDTETLVGFIELLTVEQKQKVAHHLRITYSDDNKQLASNLREAAIKSSSQIVIIPIQDWLLSRDRINIPGTEKEHDDPNWRYRLPIPIERLPSY